MVRHPRPIDVAPSSGARVTPEQFAAKLNAWRQTAGLEPHRGILLTAGEGRAVAQLSIKSNAPRSIEAGGLLAFAADTATAATLWELDPTSDQPTALPQTLQVTGDVFRHALQGTLTASATIRFRGSTTITVHVTVRDEQEQLVATVAVTQLRARPPSSRAG